MKAPSRHVAHRAACRCCGRSTSATSTRGATIRVRSRDWLEPWEPLPEPGSPDPVADREAFRARCGAWERQRQFDSAYGFGLLPARRHARRRGEPRQRAARPVPVELHRLLDRREARGQRLRARRRRARHPLRVRDARPAPLEAAIVPRNDARAGASPRSSGCATRAPRARFLQIRGVWEDHVRYAITREEWDAAQSATSSASSSR